MNEKTELQQLVIGETTYETKYTKKFLNRKQYVAPDPNNVRCVIPGVIQKVHVRPGQKVRKGESLCILEAMKMQNDIVCPFDAKVKTINAEPGQMVTKGELLVELVPSQLE
jgi:biotin carboxyl carrier protein